MSEWSQVSRRGIVKDFVAQYCNLILYALPVKADECVCDVVGAFQIEDQSYHCITVTTFIFGFCLTGILFKITES